MDKIRFAVIGMGRMGRGHVEEIKKAAGDKFELAAVCDNAPDRLENLPASWGNSYRKYSSIDEVLADKNVDMVTIAVRHLDHTPMALKVLESGRYCVIEKPVAPNVKTMKQLLSCAEAHPKHLFIRHNRRFEPHFVKCMELMKSGIIGEVQYINIHLCPAYCRRNDWMTMPEFYGGLLSNWGPHLIDQALRFLESPVVDIWADVRRVISIGAGDDLSKIILKGENGRVAEVELSGAKALQGREYEIIGSKGVIASEFGASRIHVRALDPALKLKDLKPHPENPPFNYGNFDETLYFFEADYDLPQISTISMWKFIADDILDGIPYPIKYEEALEVVRITEEVIRKSGFAPLQQYID